MKKYIFFLSLTSAFGLGFTANKFIGNNSNSNKMKKVTGIGGIFFKCKDPNKMKEWYKIHLGLDAGQYGANFEWRYADDPAKKGQTQWNVNSETAKLYEPSTKDFMINYRVENMQELVEQLKKEGVIIADTIQSAEYGKFVHIMDIEGNKIELWEPNDIEYEKLGIKMGAKTTK